MRRLAILILTIIIFVAVGCSSGGDDPEDQYISIDQYNILSTQITDIQNKLAQNVNSQPLPGSISELKEQVTAFALSLDDYQRQIANIQNQINDIATSGQISNLQNQIDGINNQIKECTQDEPIETTDDPPAETATVIVDDLTVDLFNTNITISKTDFTTEQEFPLSCRIHNTAGKNIWQVDIIGQIEIDGFLNGIATPGYPVLESNDNFKYEWYISDNVVYFEAYKTDTGKEINIVKGGIITLRPTIRIKYDYTMPSDINTVMSINEIAYY